MDQRTALTDAMTSLRAGRLDDAESTLTRMLAVAPDQPDALHLSGLCRHERGDTAAAERLIRAAIRSWPDADPQVCVPWNNLGNVLVESGQPEAAVDAYERALAAQPDAAGTWNNLAGLLRRLRRLDEAEHAARRSVAVAADDPYAWFTLARVLIEAGDVHEGLQAHARGVAFGATRADRSGGGAALVGDPRASRRGGCAVGGVAAGASRRSDRAAPPGCVQRQPAAPRGPRLRRRPVRLLRFVVRRQAGQARVPGAGARRRRARGVARRT